MYQPGSARLNPVISDLAMTLFDGLFPNGHFFKTGWAGPAHYTKFKWVCRLRLIQVVRKLTVRRSIMYSVLYIFAYSRKVIIKVLAIFALIGIGYIIDYYLLYFWCIIAWVLVKNTFSYFVNFTKKKSYFYCLFAALTWLFERLPKYLYSRSDIQFLCLK